MTLLRRRALAAAASLLCAWLVGACGAPGPGHIHYDSDACDNCRMTIADPAFAAQLVTRTGKVYRFDDPGCLATFVASSRVQAADVHSLWVNDHAHPERPVDVRTAVFVVSVRLPAPMNSGTAAFASRADAAALHATVGGRLEAWDGVLKRVAS
jgi:copper chaperone NosL